MKTGIYGGTFNPIHSGHIHILRGFIKRLGLDRVLLIPTGKPPHKRAEALADGRDRVRMCELAASEIEESAVEVSTIEIERGGKSYTFETLEELHRRYPEDELYFLMGEDMFLSFESWRRPELICSLAYLCASPRSEDGFKKLLKQKEKLEKSFNARCFVEDIPYFEDSSTQVRELASQGKSLAGLVPEKVEEYIREHDIYSKGAQMTFKEYESIVRERLSEKRFYHSKCVAKCAASLAERYGADVEKASLAGILHDITKETEPEEQLKILEQFGIILSKTEKENPKLWHSVSGAAYIEHVLGVHDREVIDAVRCHTGGRAGMSLLDKVLFIADFVSDDRDYPGIERMRKKARRSLEEAMLEGIEFTVNELLRDRAAVAVEMIEAYNEALEVFKADEKKERNKK